MTSEQLDLRAGRSLILRQLRAQWLFLCIAMLGGLLWGGMRIVVPYLTGRTIDKAIVPHDTTLLLELVVALVSLAAVQATAAGTRRYWAMRTSYRVETDLRSELYNRVNRLSFDYHDRTATGQLMSRGSADLHEVQAFLVNIPINSAYLLMAIGAFVMLLRTDVRLALLAMSVYPIVTFLSIRFFQRLEPGTEKVQVGLANLSSVVEENVAGARLVRAFGREQYEIDKLHRVADEIHEDSMGVVRLRTVYTPLFQYLPGLGQLGVLAYGGWLAVHGHMTLGELVQSLQYLTMLVWPVQSLGDMVASGQRAVVSAARVWNVLKEEPTVRDRAHPHALPAGRGRITFEDVSFGYQPGRPVLDDFQLDVPAGHSVALVGSTGSGKSTVARLLPRFYDTNAGRILIDGIDIRDVRLRDLRRDIGIVFEDTFLFSDTIRNNIAYGRLDAQDRDIERAARLAHAAEFIDQMPDGYDTIVGEQGFSLSGGQRQRLAIARAILMEPRILILDDATSSVDARMEEEIRTALREVMEGRTTIIISHRLSTISLADQVVLVDDGKVAATGTHTQLMARCHRYGEVLGQLEAARMSDEPDVESQNGDGLAGAIGMLRPHRRRLGLASISILIFTGASLAKPLAIQYALDHGVGDKSSHNLAKAGIAFFVLILLIYVFQALATYLVNRIGQDFLRELRLRLFTHYQRMSLSFFGRENAGRLVSRMTADVTTLTDVLNNGFLMLVQSILTLVGATAILIILSWQLALVTAIILPPLAIATAVFRVASTRAYGSVRERIADVLIHMQETFSGLRVVQAFAREQHNMERFGAINERNYDANVRTVKISALYFPVVEWLGGFAIGVILFYGGRHLGAGNISVGTVAAFVFYLDFIFQPIQNLSQIFDMVQSASAALNKIFGILAIESDITDDSAAEPITGDVEGRIALHDVTFGYKPTAPVLRDIEVSIAQGEHVVLVGPTGAGKSTLAKLMTRFYDPSSGVVTLDGRDLRHVRGEDLRRNVTMVPQEGFLFSGTIRDNILFGRPGASEEDVEKACKALGIDAFIRSLPDAYDTFVSFRGSRLSAGQKQLISIARAFLADPPVLILDEATSSLDPATEGIVEEALTKLLRGRTSIVIAHRLSTAEHADRVLVVDHGRIVEDGPHRELVRKGGYYSALYRQWTSGREPMPPADLQAASA